MSTMFPHRRVTLALGGLLLIDLPFFLAVAVVGWHYGYADTYHAFTDWRLDHPWAFLPTVVLAIVLIRRWRRA